MSSLSAFRATGTDEGKARVADINASKLANIKEEAKRRNHHLLTVIDLLERAENEFALWQTSIRRALVLESILTTKYEPSNKNVVDRAEQQGRIAAGLIPYIEEAIRVCYDGIDKWELANISETMYNMVIGLNQIYLPDESNDADEKPS